MLDIPKLYPQYRHFQLLVDSRQLINPQQTIFFALPGARVNGHDFIPDLLQRGVHHFVVSKSWHAGVGFGLPQVQKALINSKHPVQFHPVADVLHSLQVLVAYHRQQFNIPILGITGSNGKTIVKDWLVRLLGPHFKVCHSPRSYNSQIGLPLSVWQLNETHQIGIFEVGVSQAGEMEKLVHILQPTLGVFTNLGEAHQAGFKSEAHKLTEKLSLFSDVDWLLTPLDTPMVTEAAKAQHIPLKHWHYHDGELEVLATPGLPQPSTNFKLAFPAYLQQLPTIFQRNAATALAAGQLLGLAPQDLLSGSKQFSPLLHRLEVRAGKQDCTIINDTYSNDLTSLAAALQFTISQTPDTPVSLILSDLPQTGLRPTLIYQQVAQLLNGKIKRLIGVGQQIPLIARFLSAAIDTSFFLDTKHLISELPNIVFQKETILIKGARSFGLERLTNQLTKRKHRTKLEIDLAALAHNLQVYQQQIPPHCQLAVMVKASAYGSGSIPVAQLLAQQDVAYLVVAYTDEGVKLREAGIPTPIMVLNTEARELDLLAEFALEPVVTNLTFLSSLNAYDWPTPLRIHLEFDTGMRRMGFHLEQVPALISFLQQSSRLHLRSIFTHLAASEAAIHDAYTKEQLEQFNKIDLAFQNAGIHPDFRHALNTNGISRFPDQHMDMVRLGIGFYGLGDAQLAPQLRPALQLTARLTGIQELPMGASVGYGRHGRLKRPSRIGVLSIGYADGLPRLAGKGRFSVTIQDQQVPTVGAICMDMCMVDLTDVPTAQIDEEVIIFGPNHPIEALAEAAMTIPYEILTGIGSRVHRVYIGE